MPKTKISEYSATANSNTDVASINIDENCAPSGINNAIRAVMGHLKDFQAGTNADSFNGPTNGAHNGSVGATTPAAGTFTSLSDSGNLTFTGTGNRITGDFSNATAANRVALQTSTANGATVVNILPNGTSTTSVIQGYTSATDPDNASLFDLRIGPTRMLLESGKNGTGSYQPMAFATGGIERVRVETSGNVGIGTSSPASKLNVVDAGTGANTLLVQSGQTGTTPRSNTVLRLQTTATGRDVNIQFSDNVTNAAEVGMVGGNMYFTTAGAERARIDSSGNVLVTSPAGLGYGTGSGGTVTQATSKSTAVTLNKPTGQITMNNAALAANTEVGFQLNNSLIAATDNLIVTIPTSVPNFSSYRVKVYVGSGNAAIYLKNESGASLSDAVVLNFAVIKGATA